MSFLCEVVQSQLAQNSSAMALLQLAIKSTFTIRTMPVTPTTAAFRKRCDTNRTEKRKKRTQPPPKENHLENFSGLKEKLSRPVVDTNFKPYIKKNQENHHIHHRNLSSVDQLFFLLQRKVLHWSRAVYGFFIPIEGALPQESFGAILFSLRSCRTSSVIFFDF